MIFRLPMLFRRKIKAKDIEELDEFAEDSYRLDVAILTVTGICKKYNEKGMHSMAREINRQVGEKILQRGLRRWQT